MAEYNKEHEKNFDDYVHKRKTWRKYHEKDNEIRRKELMKNGGYY